MWGKGKGEEFVAYTHNLTKNKNPHADINKELMNAVLCKPAEKTKINLHIKHFKYQEKGTSLGTSCIFPFFFLIEHPNTCAEGV